MNCDRHDYHAVVIETVAETSTDQSGKTTTTTTQTYELFCQACGNKMPVKGS